MKKLGIIFGYEIVWYNPHRCRSVATWLLFYRRICGRAAPRIFGFDFYPIKH